MSWTLKDNIFFSGLNFHIFLPTIRKYLPAVCCVYMHVHVGSAPRKEVEELSKELYQVSEYSDYCHLLETY